MAPGTGHGTPPLDRLPDPPSDPPLAPVTPPILYEDGDLLAVAKPAGMVGHPAYRHPSGTLFDVILARQLARGEARPCLLHRLDRDTSGVVLLAKTVAARRSLVRQFERRQVRKWYLALVCGQPAQPHGAIVQPLLRDPRDRRRVVVDAAGQPATTRYRVLAADDAHALVLAEPLTGRTHQIRAHLAWLGHPIIADATYAAPNADEVDAHIAAPRQLLHAWALDVRHPVGGDQLRLVAPLPFDFAAALPDDWHALCAATLVSHATLAPLSVIPSTPLNVLDPAQR